MNTEEKASASRLNQLEKVYRRILLDIARDHWAQAVKGMSGKYPFRDYRSRKGNTEEKIKAEVVQSGFSKKAAELLVETKNSIRLEGDQVVHGSVATVDPNTIWWSLQGLQKPENKTAMEEIFIKVFGEVPQQGEEDEDDEV
ncbi:hypothetical protein HK097_005459 [Rhizophlyctis rosea]|uniref:Uncharacterized protein n=1 Tax=Rhizophlyctis rosea TaxID=64517 RepID=A0AAD5SF10_9FUNG|nr:hypothetical protein HK097_005459 [Rhizophlyctis rosea]